MVNRQVRRGRGCLVVTLAFGMLVVTGCVQQEPPTVTAPTATPPEGPDSPEGLDSPDAMNATDAPADAEAATRTGEVSPPTAEEEAPALADSLAFEPRLFVGEPGVGYLFGPEWLFGSWTLNHHGDQPVLVALGTPINVPVEGVPPQTLVLADQRDRTVWVTGTQEGRIRLSQQTFPVLEGVDSTLHAVDAVVLEPGRGLGGDGMTILPLEPAIPGREAFVVLEPADLPEDASEWEFCLQIAPVPDDLDPDRPRITPETEGTELLCSDPAPLPEDWATRAASTVPPTRPPSD